MKIFEAYNAFLEQFKFGITNKNRTISRENLKTFFRLSKKHYPSIETIVQNDTMALKILVRMFSCLPISAENMISGTEVTKYFASTVFKNVSNNFDVILNSIKDDEWPSFREGFITLFCIQIHFRTPLEETINPITLLSMIPEDGPRRQETTISLIRLLSQLQFSLSTEQTIELIVLVGPNELTLEHLEIATSLEIYITYLTQFLMGQKQIDEQLMEKISEHFDKFIREQRFSSKKI